MISLYHKTIKQRVMKKLVLLLVVFFMAMGTNVADAQCGYYKAQKRNHRTSKKAHRYHKKQHRHNDRVFLNF